MIQINNVKLNFNRYFDNKIERTEYIPDGTTVLSCDRALVDERLWANEQLDEIELLFSKEDIYWLSSITLKDRFEDGETGKLTYTDSRDNENKYYHHNVVIKHIGEPYISVINNKKHIDYKIVLGLVESKKRNYVSQYK